MWRALKKWYKYTQTVKTQYNQIYIYSPWKQRPNKNNALPLSKQNMHNKLFKQDWSYYSKEISVRQKALITFLVLYQWDFCCITADRDFTLGLYFVTFRDIHELLVSSVRLLLLRDLIKFITKNKDSQACVDENKERNAVANFLCTKNFQEWHSKPAIVRFLHFPLVLNFGPLWQRGPPYWGVWSAADTALFVAIWHQKHISIKLNNGLFNKRKWRNGHRISLDNTATCKLLTFSFEGGGRISFP